MKKTILLFLLCLHVFSSLAQELYVPLDIQKAINKGTRTLEGVPGKNYWQNRADYTIKIKFNPKNRLVSGSEVIHYINNSPDTLRSLVLRIYPNYYKKGVYRDKLIDVADESEGVILESIAINDKPLNLDKDARQLEEDGTIAYVRGGKTLPRQTVKLEITWHYTLNKGSHNRMGQVNEGAYFLAYAYPRIAVYDDIWGWDDSPYAGRNEPYFDFGNVSAEISVPKNYVVWATGELQNAEEVLQPAVASKFKAARSRDQITNIIDSAEVDQKKVTANNKWNTFKFQATDVPDFAIAISNHYMWQGSGLTVDNITGRRVLVSSVFDKNQKDCYLVQEDARKIIEIMSFDFPRVAYPYPYMTIFEGADQMEFPMLINDNPLEDRFESIELTAHEVFHTFFPFYMGTNQTRYAWMDEGWATLGEWYISPLIDTTIIDEYGLDRTIASLGKESDVPLIVPSYELEDAYFVNAYPKPALVYLYLKDMLGDSIFRKSIQYYMAEWHGKHPVPWDFFNAINKASGKNLDWYWNAWFYNFGSLDMAISDVKKTPEGYDIAVESKGNKPAPVYLELFFEDGSIQKHHETAEVWKNDSRKFVISVRGAGTLKKVTLLNTYVPDVNDRDNTWEQHF